MKTLPLQLIAALALTAALPAQTKTAIYPRDHATREGYTSNSYYHMTLGICRIQYSYERWNLDIPSGAKITEFGYRQDGSYALDTVKINFEVYMGHNQRLQEDLGNTYHLNYDATPTKVIAMKIFDLPKFSKSTAPSTNFAMLKLDAPFPYQHPKNLVTEIRVYGNSHGNLNFAYRLDEARWYAPKSSFGLACKTSASKAPTLTTNEAILKGTWHVYMSNFPAVSPTIFILGASRTKLFGVLNLPFKLDFMGMTNCYQHVDITLMWPGPTTNTSGSGSVSLPVPLDFKLVTQKIYAQMWAADMFANPAGLVTSNGVEAQFGAYPRQHRVYKSGSATPTTGYASNNNGLVTKFVWQ